MDDFVPHTGIQWNGPDVGVVQYGGGDQMVLFYNKSVPNSAKSRELGRQFNEDHVYVRIQRPGERNTVIDRPYKVEDTRRWPQQWVQFQQNKEQTAPGTPIELLRPESPSIAANLRACGVQTMEQCAELSGTAIDQIGMGAQQWANEAKTYLETAQKGVHYTHMRHELEQRDGEIRTLKHQIEVLKGQLDKVVSNNQMPSPEAMMQMLAGMMQRPQFPPAGVAPTPAFDAQAAQIAATHPSKEIAQEVRKRGRPRKTA